MSSSIQIVGDDEEEEQHQMQLYQQQKKRQAPLASSEQGDTKKSSSRQTVAAESVGNIDALIVEQETTRTSLPAPQSGLLKALIIEYEEKMYGLLEALNIQFEEKLSGLKEHFERTLEGQGQSDLLIAHQQLNIDALKIEFEIPQFEELPEALKIGFEEKMYGVLEDLKIDLEEKLSGLKQHYERVIEEDRLVNQSNKFAIMVEELLSENKAAALHDDMVDNSNIILELCRLATSSNRLLERSNRLLETLLPSPFY